MRYIFVGFCVFAAACANAPSAPTSPSSSVKDAGVSSPVAEAARATGGSELPVRGTLAASETEDGALHHLVGTGEATQLGRFTLTSDFTVDASTAMATGTATWTAANGDQIFTTTVGQAVIVFPQATITETGTITGGTGRFAEASGSLLLQRSLDLLTLRSSASITGTISLGH